MTIDRRLLAGALGLTLALAACGGSAPSPAATSAAASASPTTVPASEAPASSEAPTPSPVATEEPSEDTSASASGGTGVGDGPLTELAAQLPAEAGGVTWSRAGFNGGDLGAYGASLGVSGDQLQPILDAHGKTLEDVNMAIGAPESGDTTGGMAYAIQIEGVQASEFMGDMQLDPATMQQATIDGKEVFSQSAGGFGVWVYPKDDTLFVVLFASDEVAEDIIGQLP